MITLRYRTAAIIAACVVAALAAAFGAGRFSAPMKVETRDVERVVYKDRIVEKIVTVTAKAERRIVYRDRVVTPDGTVTEREVERTASREVERSTDDKTTTREGSSERVIERTVTQRPNWRVGVLVGASLRDPLLPIAGPLVLGAQVDYRIAGPFSVGLWANTGGAAGLAVSIEF